MFTVNNCYQAAGPISVKAFSYTLSMALHSYNSQSIVVVVYVPYYLLDMLPLSQRKNRLWEILGGYNDKRSAWP